MNSKNKNALTGIGAGPYNDGPERRDKHATAIDPRIRNRVAEEMISYERFLDQSNTPVVPFQSPRSPDRVQKFTRIADRNVRSRLAKELRAYENHLQSFEFGTVIDLDEHRKRRK